jgi:hypothetical protein
LGQYGLFKKLRLYTAKMPARQTGSKRRLYELKKQAHELAADKK